MENHRIPFLFKDCNFKLRGNLRNAAIIVSLIGVSACSPISPTIDSAKATETFPSQTEPDFFIPHPNDDRPAGSFKAEGGDIIPKDSFIMVRYFGPDSQGEVLYYFITTQEEIAYQNPAAGTVHDIFWNFSDQGEALDFACFESAIDSGQGFKVKRLFSCD